MEVTSSGATAPKVQLLRKTSSGLAGTFKNLDHHAQSLLHLVKFLVAEIPSWNIDVWHQGHNVHVLQTYDGRRLVLRPLALKGRGYVGISLDVRVSRTLEVPLAQVYADKPGVWGDFSRLVRTLTTVPPASEPASSQDHLHSEAVSTREAHA
jgi:hypothetical protein